MVSFAQNTSRRHPMGGLGTFRGWPCISSIEKCWMKDNDPTWGSRCLFTAAILSAVFRRLLFFPQSSPTQQCQMMERWEDLGGISCTRLRWPAWMYLALYRPRLVDGNVGLCTAHQVEGSTTYFPCTHLLLYIHLFPIVLHWVLSHLQMLTSRVTVIGAKWSFSHSRFGPKIKPTDLKFWIWWVMEKMCTNSSERFTGTRCDICL